MNRAALVLLLLPLACKSEPTPPHVSPEAVALSATAASSSSSDASAAAKPPRVPGR
ncbi:MAG TPA: hypothetical protein VGH28_31445 [Polyangiaceae bacterium]